VKHFPSASAAEQFRRRLDSPGLRVVTQLDTALLIHLQTPPPILPDDPVTVLPRERWSVRASDDFRDVDALRDGSAATVASVRVSHDATPWIVVDVGEPTWLSGLRVAPASASDDTIYLARVEVSLDGASWEMPRTWFEPDDRRALIERPRTVRFFDARFAPTRARFVRMVNPRARFRTGRWEIGELDLLQAVDAPAS
jgi:hypothetical protein